MNRLLTLLTLSAAFYGCAAQGPGGAGGSSIDPDRERTPSGFPTKRALEKIAALSVRTVTSKDSKKDVDTWKLEGPVLPDGATLGHPVNKPWGRMLLEKVQAKGPSSIADESMACVAREVGLFYLEHKAYPSSSLESFIVGRCAAPNSSTRVYALSVDAPANTKDEKLLEAVQDRISKLITEAPTSPTAFGLWFGQKNKQSLFLLAVGERKLHLKEVVTEADKKTTVLRGQFLVQAGSMRAVITQGAFGSAPCESKKVEFPAFEVKCVGDANDDAAWIELSVVAAGSELAEPVAGLVVSPSGNPSETYKRADYFAGAKPTSAQELVGVLHAALNRARAGAGLQPVELDAKESAAASQVAPQYFAALSGTLSTTVADTIALGLRAGWDVDGLVKSGTFMSVGPTSVDTAENMLATAFERPSSRSVLFGKDVKKVAIGTYWSAEEKRTGALFAAYSMFETMNDEQLQALVLEKLNAARAKAGKAAAKAPRDIDRVADRVGEGVPAGRIAADEALAQMTKEASSELKLTVRGNYLPFRDADAIEFPRDLLDPAELEVGIYSSAQKSELEPWAGFDAWVIFKDKSENAATRSSFE